MIADGDVVRNHEDTLRVLYHVVSRYDQWRAHGGIGMPNEFTDDAVRIGRQHLQEVGWWSESATSERAPSDAESTDRERVIGPEGTR